MQVLCLDATRPLDAWERGELARPVQRRRIVVLTKCDAPRQTDYARPAVETSGLMGQGIAELRMSCGSDCWRWRRAVARW